MPPRASGGALKPGAHYPALGARKFRAALMPGCVQGALSPAIDAATIRVLTKRGVEVVVPEGVGCCGALSHHLGKRASAEGFAAAAIRGLAREIEGEGLDFVVANAAGCGTMVKDYGFLFRADGRLKDAAQAVATRARDVTEVLDEVGLGDVRAPRRLKVAYQNACSLQHGQKLASLPRRLLSAAGFEVVEPEESHLCCGSAGSYNLHQPSIAQELRTRKIERLERLKPDIVASGNIGCITHLGAALKRAHLPHGRAHRLGVRRTGTCSARAPCTPRGAAMTRALVIYGATGYTGRLIAERAKAEGFAPVLAGRNGGKLLRLAARLKLDARTAQLDNPKSLDALLEGAGVLLNAAGPFSVTASPLIDACMRSGTHYLDITDELSVLEACAARDEEARRAGIMLMPGCGFDVVPSDCLAAHVVAHIEDPAKLVVAVRGLGKTSRGTRRTLIDSLSRGTRVRRRGKIVALWRAPVRELDFGDGAQRVRAVGWGDVVTAFHSTGVPDIECYVDGSKGFLRLNALNRRLGFLIRLRPLKSLLKTWVFLGREGPTAAQRGKSHAVFIVEAENKDGARKTARLDTPEGYTLTAMTAVEIARRVLQGEARAGFQTPSRLYGADFILGFPGVSRRDL